MFCTLLAGSSLPSDTTRSDTQYQIPISLRLIIRHKLYQLRFNSKDRTHLSLHTQKIVYFNEFNFLLNFWEAIRNRLSVDIPRVTSSQQSNWLPRKLPFLSWSANFLLNQGFTMKSVYFTTKTPILHSTYNVCAHIHTHKLVDALCPASLYI